MQGARLWMKTPGPEETPGENLFRWPNGVGTRKRGGLELGPAGLAVPSELGPAGLGLAVPSELGPAGRSV